MRRRLTLMATLLACAPRGEPPAVLTLFVAPDGDDAASGRRAVAGGVDGPLRSLAGARDALRRLRPLGRPVEVRFADGIYFQSEPVVFSPEDSGTAEAPVRFVAAPGAHPVLSGGRRLAGFTVGADGRWQLAVAGAPFSQLWVDGRRAVRARTADAPVLSVEETALGPLDDQGRATVARQTVQVDPAALASLPADQPGDVDFVALHRWDVTRRPIESLDAAHGRFTIYGYGMKPWNRIDGDALYHFEGYAAALATPGQWFLARDGTLAYLPREGEDPRAAEVIAPVAEQLVIVRGDPDAGKLVEWLSFEGLTFAHTAEGARVFEPMQAAASEGAAIELDGARSVRFLGCTFAHTGRYGIWFRRGCRRCTVSHCDLRDLGAGGVKIGERAVPTVENGRTREITVEESSIVGGGRILPCAVGVWIGQSGENTIRHDEIADFFYSGVSVGWSWDDGPSDAQLNHIDDNHIHDLGQGLMSDLGGVYTLGTSNGTTVRGNRIHDVHARSYGGWGLYDDQSTIGIVLTDNLVYRTDGSYYLQYGRQNVLANNILALGGAYQLGIGHADVTGRPLIATRNILVSSGAPLLAGPILETGVALDHNLYFDAVAPVTFFGSSLAEWNALGEDLGSQIMDPGFVGDDFRLAPGVAEKIGFQPFDASRAGPTGSPSAAD